MLIFNCFTNIKMLVASFTDLEACKAFVTDDLSIEWVGVFKANQTNSPVPMWETEDFLKDFNY